MIAGEGMRKYRCQHLIIWHVARLSLVFEALDASLGK